MNKDDLLDILKQTSIGVKGFIVGQIKLTILSFVILAIGLYIIGSPLPLLIALIIAIIDILPVVGSGIILLPWSIISFFSDNKDFAVKLIILYIILLVLRQILEPKIIGDSIGLRPLYTFLATLLGSIFLGPFGIFLGPIIAIFLNAIYLKREIIKLKNNNQV